MSFIDRSESPNPHAIKVFRRNVRVTKSGLLPDIGNSDPSPLPPWKYRLTLRMDR